MKLLMTPGPTAINERVRMAMAKPITNPDLDLEFYEFYKNICEKLQRLLKTKNTALVLSGEGILGLEAACASLIETGDRVLCIENGIFGEGFADFVKIYGGEVELFRGNRRKGIDVEELREFLKQNNDFKVATLVHCETPSGITNNIKEICAVLKEYNILSIVDAVASIGGEEVKVDEWGIDIVLGGSQKCLSAPPGLTFMSISKDAWNKIDSRKEPIKSFYCNLGLWKDWYLNKWFPYTQPISDLYAFNEALDMFFEYGNVIERHKDLATYCRNELVNMGLELYAKDSHSNTVTTVMVPEGIGFNDVSEGMLQNGIMIGGAFGFLKDKVFRIGHMGENCFEEKIYMTLKVLKGIIENN